MDSSRKRNREHDKEKLEARYGRLLIRFGKLCAKVGITAHKQHNVVAALTLCDAVTERKSIPFEILEPFWEINTKKTFNREELYFLDSYGRFKIGFEVERLAVMFLDALDNNSASESLNNDAMTGKHGLWTKILRLFIIGFPFSILRSHGRPGLGDVFYLPFFFSYATASHKETQRLFVRMVRNIADPEVAFYNPSVSKDQNEDLQSFLFLKTQYHKFFDRGHEATSNVSPFPNFTYLSYLSE